MTIQLLQQVRVIDPVSNTDRVADVLIAEGVIKAVEEKVEDFSSDTLVSDCHGLVLGPGLIDLYSHSGEPGFEERENLASLLAAATAGGFTRLCILPDTTPPIDNPAGIASIRRISQSTINQISPTPPFPPLPPSPPPHLGSVERKHPRATNDPACRISIGGCSRLC
jgi:dihydroorotase